MVEVAGAEPAPPRNANRLTARDSRRNSRKLVALWSVRCALVCSPVQETFWRRVTPGEKAPESRV